MKKEFSTSWISSKQPRKQRKYVANAPIHILRKLLSVNLSKELRKSQGKRNVVIRKGDTVVIKTGKHKKKQGKVLEVKTKYQKIYVEGVQAKKADGSKVNIPFKASNLQIIQINTEDKKRFSKKKENKSKDIKQETKSTKQDKGEKK